MSILEEFNSLPYEDLYQILRTLSSSTELQGKFIVAGGSVPYILSDTSSGREHGDIDIMVRQEDMSIVRNYLMKNHLYDKRYDSLSYNGGKLDYGVTTRIKGLPVEFYPYEEIVEEDTGEKSIIGRSYSFGETEDHIYLKENYIKGLSEKDFYIEKVLDNGYTIKTISPEALIVMKVSIGKGYLRDKDKKDLNALLGMKLDCEKLARVYNAFNREETKRTIVSKEVEKYSLEEIVQYYSMDEIDR